FAASELGLTDLEPWDIPYASERLRETRYAYSEDEIKQYFTEPRVLTGLFQVIESLFNVRLRETDVSRWHADVRGVRVESPDGALIGHLYLDLYARAGKQSGAWVDSERSRRRLGDHVQTPVVYLTCNFARPGDGKPALLTHDDVITLIHETGHALHALLSEVDEPGRSGHLYLDLYARAGKQSGAWVDSERSRRRLGDHVQTPVVYLTCNFARPGDGKPALLTHDDVITLFHETGHALHALLSEVDEPG